LHAHWLEGFEVLFGEEHMKLPDHLSKLDIGPSILRKAIVHALGGPQVHIRVDLFSLKERLPTFLT